MAVMTRAEQDLENARVKLDEARETLRAALELVQYIWTSFDAGGRENNGTPTEVRRLAYETACLEVDSTSRTYVDASTALVAHCPHDAPPDERAPDSVVLHDDGTWTVSGGMRHRGTFAPTEYLKGKAGK